MDEVKEYSETVIAAFLECCKNTEIAERTGLSTKTIHRYRKDPELRKILYERRAQYVEAAVNRLNEAMIKAVDTLIGMIENDDIAPQIRLKAIQVLLQSADCLEGTRWTLNHKSACIENEQNDPFKSFYQTTTF